MSNARCQTGGCAARLAVITVMFLNQIDLNKKPRRYPTPRLSVGVFPRPGSIAQREQIETEANFNLAEMPR